MFFSKPGKPWLTPQVSKIMRVLFFLLTVAFLQVSASGSAQKITVSGKNIPIVSVFSAIEKQTGLVFFYNNTDLAKAKPVTLELRNVTVEEGLKELFREQPLTYVIRANTIFIAGKTITELPVRIDVPVVPAPPVVIKGKITSEEGLPLAGASIQVKGKNGGTTSKTNGEFELTAGDENLTIIVSYIGYITQEIKLTAQEYVSVKLVPNANSLNSVVVVGYGTQKKQNLTGAVDQIGTEFFEDRPMPSITRGLQGALPNLNIKMTDGKPIRSATYNIRGATSIGSGSTPGALVLIDGVTGDPDNVNPSDIESVTVLKDAASASIYGARAAFGVVLITTKTPKTGKTQINYTANFSNNRRTTTPELVTDGYTWAKNYAEALFAWNDYGTFPVNIDGKLLFSQAYLDSLKYHSEHPELPNWGIDAAGNYAYYASTDWMKELYKNSNNSMEHVLSVSSATDKMKILMSGRWFSQDGIFRYNPDKFNRYNLRVKGDIKLSDKFFINANVEYATIDYMYPLTSQGGVHSIWRLLSASGYPLAPLLNPDGTLSNIASYSVGDLSETKFFAADKSNQPEYHWIYCASAQACNR
jgi:TonB-linked SusC/RagA family outer membrane protein